MRLSELLVDLPGVTALIGAADPIITRIVADSRQVIQGVLFVAYRGVDVDSHRYLSDALRRGAAALAGELPPPADCPVPYIQVLDGRAALAWLNAAWHGHPSRGMALVGVTGTDGKTTTANLLFSILRAAGRRAGLISTVNAVIGDQTFDTGLHTTTPDAPDVQRYLAQMRDAGTEIAVLETTSHGLAQHRVTGCAFDVAVITNITHEHLDFHGSYEAYRDAKALLFRSLSETNLGFFAKPGLCGLVKTAVLNRDDSSFDTLAAIPAERVITYGIGAGENDKSVGREPGHTCIMDVAACCMPALKMGCTASCQLAPHFHGPWRRTAAWPSALNLTACNIRHSPSGTQFDIQLSTVPPIYQFAESQSTSPQFASFQSTTIHFVTPLIGAFNIYNVLAATGAALALGIDPVAIRAGVAAVSGVPGRLERIDWGQPFIAIVDFAHTPNALARVLETAQGLVGQAGRVIVVLGSAGLRDREKRRLMGEVAATGADLTVITAEDPRTEVLAEIMAETAQAMSVAGRVEGQDFVQIADRQRAILYAVQQAQPGDLVIVCGKGHEQSMCFGTMEHPWRDQDALRWALEVRMGHGAPEPPYVLPTWSA